MYVGLSGSDTCGGMLFHYKSPDFLLVGDEEGSCRSSVHVGSIHFSFCLENHQHMCIAKYHVILSTKVASNWVCPSGGVEGSFLSRVGSAE